MTFPSTTLFPIPEDEHEEPYPQTNSMETFIFEFDPRKKALPIHPLNAILIQQKHFRFREELNDYFVDPGSDVAHSILSEIDDELKASQLDMLHTLYGGSEARDNLGDFKSLWEDECYYEYEGIDPEIGGRIKRAREERERASRSENRSSRGQTEGSRGIHSSGATVKRGNVNVVEEKEVDVEDISSFMTDGVLFSQPRTKQSNSLDLAEFLLSTGPTQAFPRLAYKRSGTPRPPRKPTALSPDGAKQKKYWWRLKPIKDKKGSKKASMAYSDPDRHNTHNHFNLIAPDKRARDEGRYDGRAMAEEQVMMRDVPNEKSRNYIRQMPSPSQLDDPNASVNMTRFRYSADVRSMNSDDNPNSERGGPSPDQRLQSVTEDGGERLEVLQDRMRDVFRQRGIVLMEYNQHWQNYITNDSDLSQEEKTKKLADLAKEHRAAIKAAAEETGLAHLDDEEVMKLVMLMSKEAERDAGRAAEKDSPAPKFAMGRLGKKALDWFLAIPDDDNLTSESVYLSYGATNMFPQPLQPYAKVSASEAAVSTAGSSTGVSRKRSMNEGLMRSNSNSNLGMVRSSTPNIRDRRQQILETDGSITLVDAHGGRIPTRQPHPHSERKFEFRKREPSEADTVITQMPTRSEFEGKPF